MDKYLELIDDKIYSSQVNLNRYMEGKNVLNQIIGFKETFDGIRDRFDLDLYVEVRGLNEIDFDDIYGTKIYTPEMIEQMIEDPNEIANKYVSTYKEYLDKYDLDGVEYTDIFMNSYSNGVFLKYEKYMEGLFRLWKAKYLDDVNELFPLIPFHSERGKFIKTITDDDLYRDIVTVQPKVSGWYHDYNFMRKRTEDDKMFNAVINVNDFVSAAKECGLEVYFNDEDYVGKTPFEFIVTNQKEGPFSEKFSIVYSKPLDYKPKRLVK